MDEKLVLSMEELDKVAGGDFCGGELDKGDIALLNTFMILAKESGRSKEDFYESWKQCGASIETLTYIDAHWEEAHR